MKTNGIRFRFGLCCICTLVLATRALALPILRSDDRSLTSGASASVSLNEQGGSDSASPSTLFGPFMSSVSADAWARDYHGWDFWIEGDSTAHATASQNSTITPASFDAYGQAAADLAVSAATSSGGAAARAWANSVFSVTFQLDERYLYEGMGYTEWYGTPGGNSLIRLSDQNGGTIFQLSGIGISESGMLEPGVYTLVAATYVDLYGLNQERDAASGTYSWVMNLTPASCVPDGGSTGVLAGLGVLFLLGLQMLRPTFAVNCPIQVK